MSVIQSINNNSLSPNFKAINIVQIPRKTFKCSQIQIQKDFSNALNNATGVKPAGILRAIVGLFLKKPCKTASILESFSNFNLHYAQQQNGVPYALYWFKQNMGLPIKDVMDKDYCTFYVFTKEHVQDYMTAMKKPLKKILKYAKEGCLKYKEDERLAKMYPHVKIGCDSDALIEETLKTTPIKTIRINSLEELGNIVKELDV